MKRKMKKLTLLTAVALATAALSGHAAAQTVTAGSDDLILGFNVANGFANAGVDDLEVDLGNVSQFTTTASFTLSTSGTATSGQPLSVADLISTYGSSWASASTGLTWGVAGTTTTGANSFEASSSNGPLAEESNFSGAAGVVAGLVEGLDNASATNNSAFSSVIGSSSAPASADADSFFSLQSSGGSADYSYFLPSGVTLVNGGSGNPLGSLELISYVQHSPKNGGSGLGTELGVFTLGSNGALTYTGVAAPEPSTWAMMAGAMGFLFLAVRNRRSMIS
jgi:hypothetical protein